MNFQTIALYFLAKTVLSTAIFSSNYFDKEIDQDPCICVPFWECKEDFSGLSFEEIKILDRSNYKRLRSSRRGSCSGEFDVCCGVECGRRNVDFKTNHNNDNFELRVYGGDDVEFAEFPWVLAVMVDDVYKCGASLIHPQVAITIAHCINNTFGEYKVRAGEWNWKSNQESLPHQDQTVKEIIIHPQYNPSNLHNDIALLILESPFKLAKNVGIACLPSANTPINPNNCTVCGWGRTNWRQGNRFQNTLKKIDIPLLNRNACQQKLISNTMPGPHLPLHKSFACAGSETKDACKGDGGSPLFCEIKNDNDRYVQVGIVSWGLECKLRKTLGVYVNVRLFVEWIDEEMKNYQFNSNFYRYR